MADVVAKLAEQDPTFVSSIYDHTEAIEKQAQAADEGA